MSSMVLYVIFIVLADIFAAKWIVPIGFGLFVPSGVFFIAPIFTIRDVIHRKYGYKTVVGLIFLASLISYVLSGVLGNPLLGRVAIASVLAFVVSELADTYIYHKVENQSWMNRVIKSNSVSALLDSLVFICIAFGWVLPLILGQYLVKMLISIVFGYFMRRE